MWWEYAIVGGVIVMAAIAIAVRIRRALKGPSACECGMADSCPLKPDEDGRRSCE